MYDVWQSASTIHQKVVLCDKYNNTILVTAT